MLKIFNCEDYPIFLNQVCSLAIRKFQFISLTESEVVIFYNRLHNVNDFQQYLELIKTSHWTYTQEMTAIKYKYGIWRRKLKLILKLKLSWSVVFVNRFQILQSSLHIRKQNLTKVDLDSPLINKGCVNCLSFISQ